MEGKLSGGDLDQQVLILILKQAEKNNCVTRLSFVVVVYIVT